MDLLLTGIVVIVILLVIVHRRRQPALRVTMRSSRNADTISPPHFAQRHKDAARYIRQSDDAFARAELERIKNRPEAYNYYFNKYADENRTMKIALGLVAGYLTWEMLNDDSREAELQTAMTQLDRDLEHDTVPHEANIVEQEERAQGIVYDDSDDSEDFSFSSENDEMDRLYADLDDTAYFDEMMDDSEEH